MGEVQQQQAAFKAIGEEAEKLLEMPIDGEIRDAIERIVSIARYQFDVRSDVEQHNSTQ